LEITFLKNFSGKFGRIRAKFLRTQKCACSYTYASITDFEPNYKLEVETIQDKAPASTFYLLPYIAYGLYCTESGQLPSRIMRFTHHIRAIKFSLHYPVVARRGILATRLLGTTMLSATVLLLQHGATKVSSNIAVAAI